MKTYASFSVQGLEKETEDPESIHISAKGLAEVLNASCPGSALTPEKKAQYLDPKQYFSEPELVGFWTLIKKKLEECFTRREKILMKEGDWREGAEGDDVEGERNDLDDNDENHEAAVALTQILGALMGLNGPWFINTVLPELPNMLQAFMSPTTIGAKIAKKDKEVILNKNRILAYFIACDLCEHLKEASCSLWPSFLEGLFADLKNTDFEVRHAACYFVYLAASVGPFAEYSPRALTALVEVLRDPSSYGKGAQKKYVSSDDIKIAEDNLIAAVFNICACSPALLQQQPQLWDEILKKLPLKSDTEIGAQVIIKLMELLKQQRPDVLGANGERTATAVGVIGEAYKAYDSDDTDKLIVDFFRSMGAAVEQCKGGLSATQTRKIEKLLKDATMVN